MEQLIRKKEILSVWHAFSKETDSDGWKSIRMGNAGKITVVAGCKFPGKEEYIAFGFSNYQFPSSYKYPQCKGFYVLQKKNILGISNFCWLVIIKNQYAGIDLFVTMVEDLLNTLNRISSKGEQFVFNSIISRIILWQRFLSKTKIPILSPEKELGLLGELYYLKFLLSHLDHEDVLDSWKGPLDEPKDFILGNGGVEVKSTVSSKQFRAKINSLEQLNTSIVDPLYLVGYRFEFNANGETLTSIINCIRDTFDRESELAEKFELLLMNYGYIEMYASEYTNVYSFIERIVFRVIGNFPRITEENSMSGILNAKYEIDLTNIPQENVDDEQILHQLGVII